MALLYKKHYLVEMQREDLPALRRVAIAKAVMRVQMRHHLTTPLPAANRTKLTLKLAPWGKVPSSATPPTKKTRVRLDVTSRAEERILLENASVYCHVK